MSSASNLILGRLGVPLDRHAGATARTGGSVRPVRYGVGRLGLVAQRAAAPAKAKPAHGPRRTDSKATFRLPKALHHRLKALATVTHAFQYVLAGDALQRFLDETVSALTPAQRAAMAELQAEDGPADGEIAQTPQPQASHEHSHDAAKRPHVARRVLARMLCFVGIRP